MQKLQALLILALLFPFVTYSQSENTVQAQDMKSLAGVYSGELMYLDYTSNEPVRMPLVANCHLSSDRLTVDFILNEWGKTYKQQYDFRFNGNTVRSGGAWNIVEKAFDPMAGDFRFVMTKSGRDGNDNKPCLFRISFVADKHRMTIGKEVRFDGTNEFFLRNEYRLERVEVK